jgi:uncharacterized protein (TIGR00255 family)
MTGYGRGVADHDGRRAVVEIRSVNHRFLDLKIRGSSLEPALEELIKAGVREVCTRGSVTVSVRIERRGGGAPMTIDTDAAVRMHAELTRLAERLGLSQPVTLELLCQQPGVLVAVDEEADSARIAECVKAAVAAALETLMRMRETEGALLCSDISERLGRIGAITELIAAEAKDASGDLHQRLGERVDRLLEGRGAELTADRLAQEVALIADRVDVTEELVRLRGHVEHLRALMDESSSKKSAVGRRLDFLVQEMGREINTIGSKAQSSAIAHAVIEAKSELEKIREQVQNIE